MSIFSNWRHRKILFLISLPRTAEFQLCAADVQQCIARLKPQNVDVCESINQASLLRITKYEVVIVMAHRDEENDTLVLSDKVLPINEFVEYLPSDFAGVLDFSSCYAATAMSRIKARCPQCHVLAPIRQTTLPLRLIMYPHVVELFNKNKQAQYIDVYQEVLRAVAEGINEKGNTELPEDTPTSEHAVKLGKQRSSVYAPSCVMKEMPFLIQLFFHKDEEGRIADFEARQTDPLTGLIESSHLSVFLKKKDKISVRLSFVSPERNLIHIEDDIDTKTAIWFGEKTKMIFCAIVDKEFTAAMFVGKLMIEVNSMPIGECYFTIKVAEKESAAPADVEMRAHDYAAEKRAAKDLLRGKLAANLLRLQEQMALTQDENERKNLENSIRTCMSCVQVLDQQSKSDFNEIKKVFVSSTSDMKEYREIVRKEIEMCNMFPEMYENWSQTGASPKEECCRRVINSDLMYCILGSRYGYVEPTLGMSMTEFEYRTALESGKPILVYIIDPLNPTDEPHEKVVRQQNLIEEIRNTRILKFFSDGASLAQNTARDLSRIEINPL